MTESLSKKWQIIDRCIINKTNWIEEEDLLLDWSENTNFDKYPLNQILLTFIYVDQEHSVVGVAKTFIGIETRERSSILHRSDFFDKVREANNPNFIVPNDADLNGWSKKIYSFEDAAIYHIHNDHETIDNINSKHALNVLHFHKDVEKIPNSLLVFQDLSEIFVIMREVKKIGGLRSGSKIGKTKKVRISDDSPKEYVFSKLNPVSGKRRTQKSYHY